MAEHIHRKFRINAQQEEALVERFQEPESNYELLKEGKQGFLDKEYSNRTDTDSILQLYAEASDRVIGLADGSVRERSVYDPTDRERSQQPPDDIIFLDKSARPVAWCVDALWDQFAKKDAQKPNYEFLNIDRVKWFTDQGHNRNEAERRLGPKDFDINEVSKEDIARIRAIFVEGELSEDNWQEEVWELPATLDDKNILVVDEVKNQGGTLSIATELIKHAFPSACVSGDYFWAAGSGTTMVDSKVQMKSAPVWYDSEDETGREVGDLNKGYYEEQYKHDPTQENLKKKIGWTVLSAPLLEPGTITPRKNIDKKTAQIKQDIAFLSYATASGNVPRRPWRGRENSDQDQILEQQNLSRAESINWAAQAKKIKQNVASRKEVQARKKAS